VAPAAGSATKEAASSNRRGSDVMRTSVESSGTGSF
jgi:hypothetical protein